MSRRHPHAEPVVCFDFDGTLTKGPWPDLEYENADMCALARRLHRAGSEIVVQTGRDAPEDIELVTHWLAEHDVPCAHLSVGTKPKADLYIDDYGLIHRPHLLEALHNLVQLGPNEWRRALAGNTLTDGYQAEIANTAENPDAHTFRYGYELVIPFTSGMDSMVLWLQARDEDLPYRLAYFDYGQEYAQLEQECAVDLLDALGDETPLEVQDSPTVFQEWNHILCGRNALVLHDAADLISGWGEVWFGGLAGETPVSGGDKSRRFLADTQALLTLQGKDVRVVTPLGSMDKPDLVAWLKRRGLVHLLKLGKSCFDPDVRQCGRCVACFRKWSALALNEIDPDGFFDTVDFAAVVQRYEDRIDSYPDRRRDDLIESMDAWQRR